MARCTVASLPGHLASGGERGNKKWCILSVGEVLLSPYRLVSRHGYVVVDETYRPQFTPDPSWPWVTTANVSAPTQDMCSIDPADVREFPPPPKNIH